MLLTNTNAGNAMLTVITIYSYVVVLLIFLSIFSFIVKLCFRSCGDAFRALHNDEPRVIAGGIIARDAGLSGLTKKERRLIFEAILETQLLNSDSSNETNAEKQCSYTGNVRCASSEQLDDGTLRIVDDRTCSICLVEYQEGDTLLHGHHCRHMFHKDCVLEWLEINSTCPCCRVDMVNSDQMREAARDILCAQESTPRSNAGYVYAHY